MGIDRSPFLDLALPDTLSWPETRRRLSALESLLGLAVIAALIGCGCGREPAIPVSADSESPASVSRVESNAPRDQAKADETQPAAAANPSSRHPVATTADGLPASNAATAMNAAPAGRVPSQTSNTSAQSASAPTTATPTTSPAVPVASPKASPPTPAQLAKWAVPAFEPLQLLGCRDSDEVGVVTAMAPLLDGKQYLLAGTKLTLWSVDAESPKHTFVDYANKTGSVSIVSLAVSPDGKWIAAGDSEGVLQIWNLEDRKLLVSKPLYSNDITQIAVSPDGRELATTTYDNEISVWTTDNLEPKNRFKVDTNGLKRVAYLAPDLIVAAGETTTIWNAKTGMLEKTLSEGRYHYTLRRSPDGKRFLFGDKTGLRLWNIETSEVDNTLAGSFASEEWVAFAPDGQRLLTANGNSLRVWDIASGKWLQVMDAFGLPIVGIAWLPQTRLAVVASINGRVRLWGDRPTAESLGLQPLHAAVTMPEASSQEPATPSQMLAAIDLRTFPQLPDSETRNIDPTSLDCVAPVSPEEAKQFYRYFLGEDGWTESAAEIVTPGALLFRKDGFMLTAFFSEEGESKTSVSLHHAGNYDLRWTPRFDAAPTETVFENQDVLMYRTKADLVQLETTLLRKLHAAGWTAYARLNAAHHEQPDQRNLAFLQNGVSLQITIGKAPADPSSYHVQCGRMPMLYSLPIPTDSGFVEFDGSTQPRLVASTAMSLEETRDFYQKKLSDQGWLARQVRQSSEQDQAWLPFIRGQQDLTIALKTIPKGGTLIRVGDNLENTSWQLAKPPAPPADTATIGIEAADFPMLNAKSIEFNANDKSIQFTTEATALADVAQRYTEALDGKGWKPAGSGIRSDDYVFLTFAKEDAEIDLRARLTDGGASVNIQGDGLLWTKPLPGPPQTMSYEAWLRHNRRVASLKHLDEFESEMRKIDPAHRNPQR